MDGTMVLIDRRETGAPELYEMVLAVTEKNGTLAQTLADTWAHDPPHDFLIAIMTMRDTWFVGGASAGSIYDHTAAALDNLFIGVPNPQPTPALNLMSNVLDPEACLAKLDEAVAKRSKLRVLIDKAAIGKQH